MDEQDTSLDSIVVLSNSLINENQFRSPGPSHVNCFNETDTLYESQMTLKNSPLNDTGSSSFMATSTESECQRLEREILILRSQLSAYKNENSELKQKIERKRRTSDSFTDIGSVCLVEKIENVLIETDKLFSDNFKLKISMEYLIKNLWSVIAFDYQDSKLANISKVRDDLLNKIEQSTKQNDENVQLTERLKLDMESLQECNERLKSKMVEQSKVLKEIVSLQSEQTPTEPVQEIVTETVEEPTTPTNVNDFYYYNTNGYIAIDKDLSLNEEVRQTSQLTTIKSVTPNHYKCPKCFTTVDSDSISYEMYQTHVDNCDGDSNLVCMFCLCWFTKTQQEEYLSHIDMHLRHLGNELNNM